MSYQSDYSGAQVDEAVGKALNPDATPTEGSTNLVTSGGVYGLVSNRNLLDNPWFTVNQRGQSSYAWNGMQYAVDRWKWDTLAAAPLEVQSDGVNLNASALSAGSPYIRQIIDNPTAYRGKTMTFSAIVSSVSGASNIGYLRVYAGSGTQWGTYIATGAGLWSVTFTVPSDATAFVCDIGVYSGKTAKVVAAKLELGSVSTLANDTPPCFAEELAKCQRYLYILKLLRGSYGKIGVCNAYSTSVAIALIPVPVTMYADKAPDIGYNGLKLQNGTSRISVTGVTFQGICANAVFLELAATGLTAGANYILAADSSDIGWLRISFEL